MTNQASSHSQHKGYLKPRVSASIIFRWDFLTSELGEEEEHVLVSQEVWPLYAEGDAWSQECVDFRCGEWQPWWLSNPYSVVIETMFHSAGETQTIFLAGQWTTANVTVNHFQIWRLILKACDESDQLLDQASVAYDHRMIGASDDSLSQVQLLIRFLDWTPAFYSVNNLLFSVGCKFSFMLKC